jgi:anaerobic magnesium-protoporphyrin IX monomethyl ester cyclase
MIKKILFINPKIYAHYPGALNPHLGLGYLAESVKENVEVKVIDLLLGHTTENTIEEIKKFQPDVIGITLFSFDFLNSYKLINRIKKETKLPIILGGAHISCFKEDVLKKTNADYAIYSEGEIPLKEFCDGKPVEEINGFIYRKDNQIIINPPNLPINLNQLTYPKYADFELDKYGFVKEGRIPIATARGCPYKCNYCSAHMTVGRGFRARSPENVLDELKYWHNKHFKTFEIIDDCFNYDIERAKKICDLIIENKMKIKIRCGSGIRANHVDEELLTKMKKAGLEYTAYGLESGNQKILNRMRKGITIEQAMKTFRLTSRAGINFSVNFIIGHAEETYEKATETLNLANRILKENKNCYVNFHNMIPYPGTEIYDYIKKQGTFVLPEEEYLTETATKTNQPLFETPEFTIAERKKILKKGFDISRKSHLINRLGKVKGNIVWYLVKNEKWYQRSRKFALGTKIGRRIYKLSIKN